MDDHPVPAVLTERDTAVIQKTPADGQDPSGQSTGPPEVRKKRNRKKKSGAESTEPQSLLKNDKLERELSKTDGSDFDSLVAAAIKSNNSCAFIHCSESTKLVGQTCPFCKRIFCLHHSLSEVHGCGMDAKIDARRSMLKEGIVYPGTGAVPSKLPDSTRRSQLKKALDKKLDKISHGKPKKN